MSVLSSRSRLRWGVPVAAAVLLAGAGPLINTVTASAHGSLAPRTAAQLLVDVQHAKLQGLSGTVVQTSNLGLPSLPTIGGAGGDSVSFSSLVSGSHTMRLWYAGPTQVRVALLGQLGESDLIRNGSDVWSWSSSGNTATHYTVPTDAGSAAGSVETPGTTITPQQAAQQALKAIDPSTEVTTDPTAVVAGRSAYELVLVPRDARSLVGSVRIAIDGKTHIPTRVEVYARGAKTPAFEVGFTSFSTATPPASTFAFSPPPGATVKQGDAPSVGQHASGPRSKHSAGTRVVGKGWTSVVVTKAQTGASGQQSALTGILKHLPAVSGSWGSGHLLQGSLFSALLTDRGQLVVGAVAPSQLYAALARS